MLVQTVHVIGDFTDDEIHDAMAAAGMGVDEMLRFVHPGRGHIREGLFEVDAGLYHGFQGRLQTP